jgi:hypothetical protein
MCTVAQSKIKARAVEKLLQLLHSSSILNVFLMGIVSHLKKKRWKYIKEKWVQLSLKQAKLN